MLTLDEQGGDGGLINDDSTEKNVFSKVSKNIWNYYNFCQCIFLVIQVEGVEHTLSKQTRQEEGGWANADIG